MFITERKKKLFDSEPRVIQREVAPICPPFKCDWSLNGVTSWCSGVVIHLWADHVFDQG